MPRSLSNPSDGQPSHGDDVKFLQTALNAQTSAQPALAVDGEFGPLTEARVREYQTRQGLTVDGWVGPQTWGRLLGRNVVETPGFFVLGRDLYDREGTRVLLRGVNKMSVWEPKDFAGNSYFTEIRKTGANSVRIVWAMRVQKVQNGPYLATDPQHLDHLIGQARANHLIPMIELHDATGGWGDALQEVANYWVSAPMLDIIRNHAAYLLVNIANEAGDHSIDANTFQATYAAIVRQLRQAGIHTPLVIDSAGYGKDLPLLDASAPALLQADPEGNLLFSVHPYWAESETAGPAIETLFQNAVNAGYPLIVGELCGYGAYVNKDTSICSEAARVDYRTLLKVCDQHQIGYYAWEWGPGNTGAGDKSCTVMDMTLDGLFDHLQNEWAIEVALTSPYSIRHTSKTPGWL